MFLRIKGTNTFFFRRKPDVPTIKYTMCYDVNIEGDENFRAAMLEDKKRKKPDKNVHCVQLL